MKNEFTTGPWKYSLHPLKIENGNIIPGGGTIHAPSDIRIFGRDPRETIAYLPGWYKSEEHQSREANAKLLAAAPELFEVLCKFKEFISSINPTGMSTEEISLLVGIEIKFDELSIQTIQKATL